MGGTVVRVSRAASGRRRSNRRIVVSSVLAQHGSGLLILSKGGFEILVGNVDLLLQRVELGILKNLPPFSRELLVAGFGSLPVADFFVCRRGRSRRQMIIRSNNTAAKGKNSQCKNYRGPISQPRIAHAKCTSQGLHLTSPGSVAGTI